MLDQQLPVKIHNGMIFRARGGPMFRDVPVGEPGLYRAIGDEVINDRVYIVAYPVDRHGVQTGGTMLIYAKGDAYALPELPEWICKPYVLTTKTKMVREDVKMTRGNQVKRKSKEPELMMAQTSDPGGARNVAERIKRVKPTGGMSMLDAAAEILKRTGKPMHVKEMIPAMADAGLWQTVKGKTPWATLWTAIPRDDRFVKTAPGVFGLK